MFFVKYCIHHIKLISIVNKNVYLFPASVFLLLERIVGISIHSNNNASAFKYIVHCNKTRRIKNQFWNLYRFLITTIRT